MAIRGDANERAPGDLATVAGTSPRSSSTSSEASESGVPRLAGQSDGGVSISTVSEFWSGALGLGPRLDVGVRVGGRWAAVIAEGARFATGGGAATMVFNLESGMAYGAPYAQRSGLGGVALIGAERLAIGGDGGLWMWSFTASLGLRASVACGPVNVWLGTDVLARSRTMERGDGRIPPVTVLLSLGFLVPSLSPTVVARDRTPLHL
jgi:hypothetical protein